MSIARFGSWKSPITTQLITQGSLRLGAVKISEGHVVWNEARPLEEGRSCLVVATVSEDGHVGPVKDLTPPSFNVRTTVHEYGGGEYTVAPGGSVFFSNMKDQRIYHSNLHTDDSTTPPTPLTDPKCNLRFADYILDTKRQRLIAVVEDHTDDRPSGVKNFIGAISIAGADKEGNFLPVETLVEGEDFYSSPRLNQEGTTLAYVSWNHPMMPWDETTLSTVQILEDGTVGDTSVVAGGSSGSGSGSGSGQSVLAPVWSPTDGKLYFTTDTTGWWSIFRQEAVGGACTVVATQEGAEFAGPPWTFGSQPYAFLPSGEILCTFGDQLAVIDTNNNNTLTTLPMPPHSAYGNVAVGTTAAGSLLLGLVGGSSSEPAAVKCSVVSAFPFVQPSTWTVVRKSTNVAVEDTYLSKPEKISFPTENGRMSHMYYYPPTNGDALTPSDELPPLLVKSHGGPTSAASSAFSLAIQFWTSRGFAVADVNYGGSTGYGKEYRQRLTHPPSWGIVDVDDCTNAATFLATQGRVDSKRMAISGGSAGGFTTLACLAFRDVFSAGASHYGIGNLEALAADTHKFESRYLDRLVGAYPSDIAVYKERSPINSVDQFSCPLIQFQGLEDKVVPPNQALEVFDALLAKGVPTACVLFEGEQHGFRRAQNIRRALDTELEFYGQVFNFEPVLPEDHVALLMNQKVTVPIDDSGGGATKL